MVSIDNTIVYLGNLRKDMHSEDLQDHIYDLFRNKLRIQITRDDISVHINQKADSKYAFVNCYEEHNAKHALDQLDGWKSSGYTHTSFNWNSICRGLESLTCNYKRVPNPKNKIKSEEKKRKGGDSHLPDSTGKVDALTEDKHYQHQNHNNSYSFDNGDNNPRKFYLEGEHLGNETRNTEFKEGYRRKKYRKELFPKYICAFLNSGEGGTLYLGVNDSGQVQGVSCSQDMEDKLRLDIDAVIKTITPTIFPKDYDVKFTPVNKLDGIRKGDYKVIEITVHAKKDLDRLYSTSHEVFLRREGSVQTLNVEHVQEWFILKNQRTIRQMKEEMKGEMKEQKELYEKRIQDEKELCERRIQNEKQLHEKYERSHNEQKRSKFCVVL